MGSIREASSSQSPVSFQVLAGAAERSRKRMPGETTESDLLALVEATLRRLERVPFEPEPLDAFETASGGKTRVVASPRASDRLVEEALLPSVRRAVEPLLAPGVHGYRRGRSTFTAAIAAWKGLVSGRCEVLMTDVAAFYDSVDRARLSAQLARILPEGTVRVLDGLLAAPYSLRGRITERSRGIPPGRVLSPILANLHLSPLDASLGDLGGTYLRYGDDLFFSAAEAGACDEAEARIAAILADLGLIASVEKRRRFRFDGQPFLYLGHLLDARGVYERLGGPRLERLEVGAATPPADGPQEPGEKPERVVNRRCQTLYVSEPGLYLKARDGLVNVLRGKEVIQEVPLHRVDRILVLAGVAMTSGFLTACISRGVPVLFFVGRGRAYGSLVAGGIPNPLRLQSQYRLTASPERRLALGREIVDAKLRAMLRRLANARKDTSARNRISEILENLREAADPESLRGREGAATRLYYEGFAGRLRSPAFRFEKRTRRPPRDPVNSLLSFAYSLLFSEMQTALLAHGLDPHPGLLHDLARNHPALASDLIEPYRVLVADSFVLTLVNNSRVAEDDFERRDPGVFLTPEGRRKVLHAWEAFMGSVSGGARGSGRPRDLVDAAANAMLEVVLGEKEDLALPLTPGEADDDEVDEEEGEG